MSGQPDNDTFVSVGAGGFHSAATLRDLEWIGELDIEYDGSTFDTDPFEPQPDGVGTMFPFLVRRKSARPLASKPLISEAPTSDALASRFFVELPYTLPQDHCLFVILKEKDIRIWKEKLGWIAGKGGMAMLSIHPDYMKFGERSCAPEEYDVSMYLELPQYIESKYKGHYLPAL